jgi:hypothetical protein
MHKGMNLQMDVLPNRVFIFTFFPKDACYNFRLKE